MDKITTDLFEAARKGDIDAANAAIAAGADLTLTDELNRTPLHWAAMNSQEVGLMLSKQSGLDLNVTDLWGQTALHLAVVYGFTSMVQSLISQGCELGIHDDRMEDPLQLAVKYNRPDIADVLKGSLNRKSQAGPVCTDSKAEDKTRPGFPGPHSERVLNEYLSNERLIQK